MRGGNVWEGLQKFISTELRTCAQVHERPDELVGIWAVIFCVLLAGKADDSQ